MGTLSRIGLRDLVHAHDLNTLVETGTGHGHSVISALQVPELRVIHSIEVDHETWHRNTVVFSNEPRVSIHRGESAALLPKIIEGLAPASRVLWFLDAHFPGSGRLEPLPMKLKGSAQQTAPVEPEVAMILGHRKASTAWDVFVVDDLCLFEPGEFEHDAHDLRLMLDLGGLGWLEEVIGDTHTFTRVMRDGGYLIARPK